MAWLRAHRRGVLVVVLFAVLGLVSQEWYRGGDYLWGIDANFPINLQTYTYQYFHIWNDKAIPGGADPLKLPLLVPMGVLLQFWFLAGLPFSGSLFQHLLLYGLFVGAELSMFRLFRTMFADQPHVGAIVAGVFYASSFYAIIVEWAPTAFISFEYAFFPLVLATFIRRLRGGRLSDAAVVAVLWTLTITPSYITVPLALLDWGLIALYAFVSVAFAPEENPALRTLRFAGSTFAFWALLNLFWIIPLANYGSTQLGTYGPTSHTLFLLNSAPLEDAFRMVGYFGLRVNFAGGLLYPWYPIYDTAPFILIGYLLPILAVFGTQIYRHRKETLFAAGLMAGALFLIKGPNPPFGNLNEELYSIPFIASGFRSTYTRFMELVSFSYSILIGLALGWLVARGPREPLRLTLHHGGSGPRGHMARLLLAAVLAVLILGAYAWPAWTGVAYDAAGVTPSRRVDFPPAYLGAATWLDEQQGDFNFLPVPYSTTNNVISYLWNNGTTGYVGVYPLQLLSTHGMLVGPGGGAQLVEALLNGTIDDCAYLNLVNVRFIVLSLDTNWPWVENESTYLAPTPGDMAAWPSTLQHCQLAATFGPILVYQNLAWVPSLVRVTNETRGYVADRPPVAIDSWNRSTSPYQLEENPDALEARTTTAVPIVAILNVAFDSHWELWVNGARQPDSTHFQVYSYMNAWIVNATGQLTLRFVFPETAFELGAYGSLAAFPALLAFVAVRKWGLSARTRKWLRKLVLGRG